MIGIFGIIYGVMNKEFVGNNAEIYNTIISSYPLRFNTISFFGMSFKLINFLLINEILIMLGIYTFLFYDDREIKKILKVKKKCNLGDTALNQNSHEYFTWDEYKDIMNYEKLYLKFDIYVYLKQSIVQFVYKVIGEAKRWLTTQTCGHTMNATNGLSMRVPPKRKGMSAEVMCFTT
jgi:hypothetical protein